MLEVNVEKIVPVTEARDKFNQIIDDVEGTDELYVLTKNGKPAAVVVGVNHLQKLTGDNHTSVAAKIDEATVTPAIPEPIASSPIAEPVAATPPVDLSQEESQTVFASADDAASPAPADDVPADPFALAAEQLAAENNTAVTNGNTAVTDPNAQLAEADLNQTMPSLENAGQVSRINPVPEGFSTTFPTAAPSQERPEDLDSVVAPDDNMAESSLAPDPLAAAEPAAPTTQFASADDADDAAGPIIPPAQAA